MNSLDIAVIVIVLTFGALGAYWGLIRQLLAVTGLVAGIVLASRYHVEATDVVSVLITDYTLARVIAFILVMVGVNAAASLLATLLHQFVGLLFLGWLDHLIVGLLGALQGFLFCTVLLIIAVTYPADLWASLVKESMVASTLTRLVGELVLVLLPSQFHSAVQFFWNTP